MKDIKKVTIPKTNYVENNIKGSKVAFVFSCPGAKEADEGKVCAGTTGKNLNLLLFFLNKDNPSLFPSLDRYNYTIANSSSYVHYGKGNTEPKQEEIEANIPHLKSSLNGAKIIICMGEKAKKAMNYIKVADSEFFKNIMQINSSHLSPKNINFRHLDIEKDIAKPILEALSK